MKNSLLKNLSYNYISVAVSYVFSFALVMYLSRVLGPTRWGSISFGKSVIAYFSFLMNLGLPTYALAKLPQYSNDRSKLSSVVKTLFKISVLLSVLSSLIFVICILFVPKIKEEAYVFIFLFLTSLLSAIDCEWLLKAMLHYKYIAVREIFAHFFCFLLTLIFVKNPENYIKYTLIYLITFGSSYIVNFWYMKRIVNLRDSESEPIREHIRPIFTYMLMTLAGTLYTYMDSVMLGFMKGSTEVGYYDIAITVKQVISSISMVLWTTLLPECTRLWSESKFEEYRKIIRKSLITVSIVIVPLVMVFFVCAPIVVHIVAGTKYDASVPVVRVLLLAVIAIGYSNVSGGQILIATGNEKMLLKSQMLGAIVNIILNSILIGRYGMLGASVATLIAEIVVCTINAFYSKRIFDGL